MTRMRDRIVVYFDPARDGDLRRLLAQRWASQHPNIRYSESQAVRLVLIDAFAVTARAALKRRT